MINIICMQICIEIMQRFNNQKSLSRNGYAMLQSVAPKPGLNYIQSIKIISSTVGLTYSQKWMQTNSFLLPIYVM